MLRTNQSSMIFTLAAAVVALLTGCASTTMSTVWKSPEPAPGRFEKVLALVLNSSAAERRAGEDELVRSIKSVPAVAAYTLVSDEDSKDRAKIVSAIQGQGFDAAAVIRLVSTDTRTTYVPPDYTSSYDPFYYHSAHHVARSGYTTTDTIVTAEASLYSVKDQKLLWAGSSTTTNPSSIKDLVAQVARAAAEEIRRQGVFK